MTMDADLDERAEEAKRLGIVGENRSDPDQDRIMARAQQMAMAPRAFRRDPAAVALGVGDIAIGALRDLQRDHRPDQTEKK